jgi:hypothetical protein
MSDQNNNVEQPTFTQSQVEEIIALVTRRVRENQQQEAEERIRGSSLPTEIYEELDHYAATDNLHKAIQKFKKEVHKYNNEEWITAEAINPNFINDLKQYKVDSIQLTSTIHRFTETTRVQARAATQIYERLNLLCTKGFQPGDETIIIKEVESLRRLAVYGYGAAKLQESEARDITLKAIKLPPTLKHLEPQQSNGEKKYAFSEEFLEQYYDETFKQRITNQATNKGNYNNSKSSHNGYGSRGGRGGYNKSRPFRGRGRGTGPPHQTNRPYTATSNSTSNDTNQ